MSNSSASDFREGIVAYPLTEKAYAFVNPEKIPFSEAVLGITLPNPRYKMDRGQGNFINLFEYIIEGEGKVLINGQWQHAAAGDFYIICAGERQCYRSSESNPWKKLWINYTASYVPAMLSAYGVESGVYRAEGVRELFEQLISLPSREKDKSEIAFLISDKVNEIIKAASRAVITRNEGEHAIKRRLEAYVHRKFSLDDFAEELHMSKSNVIRIFKRDFGVTPYEYLLDLKIATAKALLKDTGLPVKKIAEKLAISDEHYFSALFLKRVGKRPGEYRKGGTYSRVLQAKE